MAAGACVSAAVTGVQFDGTAGRLPVADVLAALQLFFACVQVHEGEFAFFWGLTLHGSVSCVSCRWHVLP
jgi:hypothetical protein